MTDFLQMTDEVRLAGTMLAFILLTVMLAVLIRRRQLAKGRPTVSGRRFVAVMVMYVVVFVAAVAYPYAGLDLDLRPLGALLGVVLFLASLVRWLARGADDRP